MSTLICSHAIFAEVPRRLAAARSAPPSNSFDSVLAFALVHIRGHRRTLIVGGDSNRERVMLVVRLPHA
jgi:hypothetical protein